MGTITKAMVLQGTEHRQTVEIPEYGEDATMVVHPISDNQFMTMQATIFEGISMDDSEEPMKGQTMIEVTNRERLVRRMGVAFGLSCDGQEWTPEEVEKIPPGAVDKLYTAIALISGFPIRRRKSPAPSVEEEEEQGSPT